MITKIREINYLGTWDGLTFHNETILTSAENSIFIVKDENDKYGIINSDESEFLPIEYDSITPLGFSLWQLKIKDKVGALQLCLDDNNTLQIGWQMPCEYDYLIAEHDCIIKASKYLFDSQKDVTDVFFTEIDLKIADAWCETLSWDYYYVVEHRKNLNDRVYLINSKDGSKFVFDKDYCIIGCKEVEDVGLFVMVEDSDGQGDSKSMIIKISRDGSIKRTAFYDGVPTVIYGPDPKGMDEVVPIAFVGEREGLTFYIDAELKESEYTFKEISIQTRFSGKTVTGGKINGILAEYYVGKKSRAKALSLNSLL